MAMYELMKLKMEIDELEEVFDEVCELFSRAQQEADFNNINEKLNVLKDMIAKKKDVLVGIMKERKRLNEMLDERWNIIKDLTQQGYLMAMMRIKVDKAKDDLNNEATEAIIVVCCH